METQLAAHAYVVRNNETRTFVQGKTRGGLSPSRGSAAPRVRPPTTCAPSSGATPRSRLAKPLGDGDRLNGKRFGHADLAAASMVRSVQGLAPRGSPLARWHARVAARPAVAETFTGFGAAAIRRASVPDVYTTAGRRRACRDHRLEWLVRPGGIDIVRDGLRDDAIRFSWPGGEGAPGNTLDTRSG